MAEVELNHSLILDLNLNLNLNLNLDLLYSTTGSNVKHFFEQVLPQA